MPTTAPGPMADIHAHIYLTDQPLVGNANHRRERAFTTDDYLPTPDDHGVLFGVIAAPSFQGSYNDHTLDALAGHDRLRATAIVVPDIDLYSLKAMDAAGIVGTRFSLRNYAGLPDLTTPTCQRLIRRIATLAPQLLNAGVNLVTTSSGIPARWTGRILAASAQC